MKYGIILVEYCVMHEHYMSFGMHTTFLGYCVVGVTRAAISVTVGRL